jgi:hypothetical protein
MSLPLNIERDAIYVLDNNILSITCIRVTQLVLQTLLINNFWKTSWKRNNKIKEKKLILRFQTSKFNVKTINLTKI